MAKGARRSLKAGGPGDRGEGGMEVGGETPRSLQVSASGGEPLPSELTLPPTSDSMEKPSLGFIRGSQGIIQPASM